MSGLWLIGFRGSGKTTLGRAFASANHLPFLDLDEEWEKEREKSILAFVESKGIAAFRLEEEKFLASAAERMEQSKNTLVVATGGGFVDWEPSRNILLQSAQPKAFLSLPAEALWERLKDCQDRQKIGGLTHFPALQNLLEKRLPFYEKIATFRLENYDIDESLTALKRLWGKS